MLSSEPNCTGFLEELKPSTSDMDFMRPLPKDRRGLSADFVALPAGASVVRYTAWGVGGAVVAVGAGAAATSGSTSGFDSVAPIAPAQFY